MKQLFKSRFALLLSFITIYITFSSILRIVLYLISITHYNMTSLALIKILIVGFIYDFGAALFFSTIYSLYLLVVPSRFTGLLFDKIVDLVFYNYCIVALHIFVDC